MQWPTAKRYRTVFILITGLFALVLALFGCQKSTADEARYPKTHTFEFLYSFKLNSFPEGAKRVDVWVPVPQTRAEQTIHSVSFEGQREPEIYQDPLYGNKMAHFTFTAPLPDSIQLSMKILATRNLVNAWQKQNNEHGPGAKRLLDRFLQPDSLVPIGGKIAAEAARVVKPGMSTLEKARALYDYVVSTVKYDKSGEGWGRGDAIYACDARRGNCTDFHSLFIGLARSSGIPARFIMGFPVADGQQSTAKIGGYHCWAEFYEPNHGWIPVDASEAFKHPELKDFLFGSLDPNRLQFTMGRDIPLKTSHGTIHLNYLIYPYVEVDGRPYSKYSKNFLYRKASLKEVAQLQSATSAGN
ncbi:MAG: transglutaminase domain-containing protein [Calditrichaeota bacterium]|nr:MAG: transglutaminase domain-containing protein [Calditrichota bacterium]